MRVITGSAKGRKLFEPNGYNIRPTTAKVKEAMFNIAQFDIEGRDVLDLFAGTGQLGIEALSRGAKSCVFIDESRDAMELIRKNIARCAPDSDANRVPQNAACIQTDAIRYLERCGKFGLIFLDPPYDSGLLQKALGKIWGYDVLTQGGIIICETGGKTAVPAEEPYRVLKEYKYGKTTRLTVYTRD